MTSQNKSNDKKVDEKKLEQQLNDILSDTVSGSSSTSSLTKGELASAITALLLFRTTKRLQRYSLALLALTAVFAASMIALAIVLAFVTGLIP